MIPIKKIKVGKNVWKLFERPTPDVPTQYVLICKHRQVIVDGTVDEILDEVSNRGPLYYFLEAKHD